MSTLSADTHPEMEELQICLIRDMPAWKTLAIHGIKQRNPNATPQQIHRKLAELMLGAELAQKVYGDAG